MAWQNGPGAGYMEAKAEVLAAWPDVRVKRESRSLPHGTPVRGYFAYRGGICIAADTSARAVWNKLLDDVHAAAKLEKADG